MDETCSAFLKGRYRFFSIVQQDVFLSFNQYRYKYTIGRPGATHEMWSSGRAHPRLHFRALRYATVVGEGGNPALGGERRRISIA